VSKGKEVSIFGGIALFVLSLQSPASDIERKKTEESGTYPFEINDVCLEGGAARFLVIEAMAEHAGKWLSCQGILHCLTETRAILYIRGAFCAVNVDPIHTDLTPGMNAQGKLCSVFFFGNSTPNTSSQNRFTKIPSVARGV